MKKTMLISCLVFCILAGFVFGTPTPQDNKSNELSIEQLKIAKEEYSKLSLLLYVLGGDNQGLDGSKVGMANLFAGIERYFDLKNKAKSNEFNPKDLSEEYSSLEEKKKDLIKMSNLQKENNDPNYLYGKSSLLKQFHAITVYEFVQKHLSIYDGCLFPLKNITVQNYLEWGCKDFKDIKPEETKAKEPNNIQHEMTVNFKTGVTTNTYKKIDLIPYDLENDPNLPKELKEKLSSSLVALNTSDPNLYYADMDFKSYYDLLSGKISICDLHDMATDLSIRDLREKQERLNSKGIKNFEEFKKAYIISEENSPFIGYSKTGKKIVISSIEINPKKDFAVVRFQTENYSNFDPCYVEWYFWKGIWWHGLER